MTATYTFKFILIGSSGVGKTAILKRLIEDTYDEEIQSTIGVEFDSKLMEIEGESVKLQIWDTAGQERFRSIAKSYFRNAVGVILVYDITEKKTFEDCNSWLNEVHSLCRPDIPVLLIGNKTDKENKRAVPVSEAEAFATHQQLKYIETSAQDGSNVQEAFIRITTEVFQNEKENPTTKNGMHPIPPSQNSGCNC